MDKKLIFAIIAAYIAQNIFQFLYHGNFMMPYYTETANLWRSEAGMTENMHFMYIGHFLFIIFAALIFAKGYEAKKWHIEGTRFGLLLGFLVAATMFASHSWLPLPIEITMLWVVGAILEGLIIGLTLAFVYKKD